MAIDEQSVSNRPGRRIIDPETLFTPYEPPPRPPRAVGRYIFAAVLLLFLGAVAVYFFTYSNLASGELQGQELKDLIAGATKAINPVDASAQDGKVPLNVRTIPSGAEVSVDFETVGVSPLEYSLEPGAYVVTVQMENFAPFDTVVFLDAGSPQDLVLRLGPESNGSDESTADRGSLAESNATSVPAPVAQSPTSSNAARQNSTPNTTSSATDASARSDRTEPPTSAASGSPTNETPSTESGDGVPPTSVFAQLVVSSHPAGADAYLDGMHVGTTPFSMRGVPPGSRRLRVSLDGYEHYLADIEAVAGETHTVHVELSRRSGQLSILVRPWGSIYINGTLHQRTSDVKYVTTLPVGEYTITAVHPQLGSERQTVTVEAETTREVVFDLEN